MMESVTADNESELTSTMGNVIPVSSNEEKNDTSDATPTSSTDANTCTSAAPVLSDDPISSTSSDTTFQMKCSTSSNDPSSFKLDEDIHKGSSGDNETDLLGISNIPSEKITEDVEDLVHDLESLLGEPAPTYVVPSHKQLVKENRFAESQQSTSLKENTGYVNNEAEGDKEVVPTEVSKSPETNTLDKELSNIEEPQSHDEKDNIEQVDEPSNDRQSSGKVSPYAEDSSEKDLVNSTEKVSAETSEAENKEIETVEEKSESPVESTPKLNNITSQCIQDQDITRSELKEKDIVYNTEITSDEDKSLTSQNEVDTTVASSDPEASQISEPQECEPEALESIEESGDLSKVIEDNQPDPANDPEILLNQDASIVTTEEAVEIGHSDNLASTQEKLDESAIGPERSMIENNAENIECIVSNVEDLKNQHLNENIEKKTDVTKSEDGINIESSDTPDTEACAASTVSTDNASILTSYLEVSEVSTSENPKEVIVEPEVVEGKQELETLVQDIDEIVEDMNPEIQTDIENDTPNQDTVSSPKFSEDQVLPDQNLETEISDTADVTTECEVPIVPEDVVEETPVRSDDVEAVTESTSLEVPSDENVDNCTELVTTPDETAVDTITINEEVETVEENENMEVQSENVEDDDVQLVPSNEEPFVESENTVEQYVEPLASVIEESALVLQNIDEADQNEEESQCKQSETNEDLEQTEESAEINIVTDVKEIIEEPDKSENAQETEDNAEVIAESQNSDGILIEQDNNSEVLENEIIEDSNQDVEAPSIEKNEELPEHKESSVEEIVQQMDTNEEPETPVVESTPTVDSDIKSSIKPSIFEPQATEAQIPKRSEIRKSIFDPDETGEEKKESKRNVYIEPGPLELSEESDEEIPTLQLETDSNGPDKVLITEANDIVDTVEEIPENICEETEIQVPIEEVVLVQESIVNEDVPGSLETLLAVQNLEKIDVPKQETSVLSDRERREMEALRMAVESITEPGSTNYDSIEHEVSILEEVPLEGMENVVSSDVQVEATDEVQVVEGSEDVPSEANDEVQVVEGLEDLENVAKEDIQVVEGSEDLENVAKEDVQVVEGAEDLENVAKEDVQVVEGSEDLVNVAKEDVQVVEGSVDLQNEAKEEIQVIESSEVEQIEAKEQIQVVESSEANEAVEIVESSKVVHIGVKEDVQVVESTEIVQIESKEEIQVVESSEILQIEAEEDEQVEAKNVPETNETVEEIVEKDLPKEISTENSDIIENDSECKKDEIESTEDAVNADHPFKNDTLLKVVNEVQENEQFEEITKNAVNKEIDTNKDDADSNSLIEEVIPDSSETPENEIIKEVNEVKVRSSDRNKRHKKSLDNKTEELSINVDVGDKEKSYSPKITIKPIKVPDEEVSTTSNSDTEIGKGALKMTITKQSDKMHTISKMSDSDHADGQDSDEPLPKLKIKSKALAEPPQKMATRSSKQTASTSNQRSGSPRITIKPVVKPEKPEHLSPLKIKIGGLKSEDTSKKHSPKLNIKPIEEPKESIPSPRKVLIKPIVKAAEDVEATPRITIKPIPKPELEKESSVVVPQKIHIKPVKKPEEEDEIEERSSSSPKITIKPIIKPVESEVQDEEVDDEVKKRIVLKINKGNIPTKDTKKKELVSEEDKSEKLAKITVKISKEGGHHIVQQAEDTLKRPHEDTNPGDKSKKQKVEVESIISTRSKHKDVSETTVETRSKHKEASPAETRSKQKEVLLETPTEKIKDNPISPGVKHKEPATESLIEPKRIKLRESRQKENVEKKSEDEEIKVIENKINSPIVVSEDSRSQDSGSCVVVEDSTRNTSVLDVSDNVKPVVEVSPNPMPRKRGRPRKVPLEVRQEFKEQEDPPPVSNAAEIIQSPVHESGRPKRSCRGQSALDTLGLKPRKPRGGRGRGAARGMGTRAVPMKPEKSD